MPQADQITSLEHAVSSYNSVLSLLLDKHAPATTVKFFEVKIIGGHQNAKLQDRPAELLKGKTKKI